MIKCLAIICLLGLTVSAFESESGSVGQRSNRMNMLTRHVGARMLAGTNGQGQDFQMNSGFVPIPRVNTMQSNGAMDNTIGGQQQLTPEQMQQLQSFLSSQQQSIAQQQQSVQQKPVTSQFQPTQSMSGQTFTNQQQFQQPTQQQQQTMSTSSSQFGQQPQQVFRSSLDTGFNSFDNQQQQQQQQFTQGQGRMMMQTPPVNTFGTGLSGMGLGTVSTTTTTTTTPIMPITSFMMAATTTPTSTMVASKPSPTEQQLLEQQIHIQKLKEQLFNMQQQQKQQLQQQQQPSTVPVQTPSSSTSFVGTPSQQLQQQQQFQQSIQQSQALQQQQLMQQEQKQQQKINMQQQLQQQQLLDQINQLNQQKPAQAFPTQQQQQFSQFQQPVSANVSRMVTQVRPMPTQPVQQQQQMFVSPKMGQQQQMGRGVTDICAGREDGDLLPHPVDETQFIVCGSLGEITLMDCPNHTVFNPHLKLCDLTSEMPTLCKSNPCLNGAKCIELSPTQFQCECPAGFSGRTCEKFDTCSSAQPCGSDGVCLSFALGSPIPHVCLCNGGRSVGISCQQAEQNPCLMPGSSTKLMSVNFNRAVFAHCEGARPHFKFCQPPLMFSAAKQSCEWSV